MSYTKREWATGNVVGAVDLNRIENGIADIDVDEIRGWGTESTQLFSESVATATAEGEPAPVGALAYSEFITAPFVTVLFNGIDYTVPMIDNSFAYIYGEIGNDGPNFTNYPFCIVSINGGGNMIYTEIAGTYTIGVTAIFIEVGDMFKRAVMNALGGGGFPMLCVSGVTLYSEMDMARETNRLMYFYTNRHGCFFVADVGSTPITIVPTNPSITAEFDNDNIFTVIER